MKSGRKEFNHELVWPPASGQTFTNKDNGESVKGAGSDGAPSSQTEAQPAVYNH